MMRFWSAAMFVLLPLLVGQTAAQAQSCSLGKARAVSTGGAGTAQLQRQLAAIRAIERKRECTKESSQGGWFNACRGLAMQRKQVEAQIAALGASRAGSACRTVTRPRNKTSRQAVVPGTRSAPQPRREKEERASKPVTKKWVGKTLLYCVRLSDGYLFPAPNSQFVSKDAAEAALRQCQFICEDQGMDVYVLENSDLETEEMTSVRNGNPYKDLPRAFLYRAVDNFKRCNWNRYVERIYELQLAELMSKEMKDAQLPVPALRPEADNEISNEATASIEAHSRPLIERPVRIIGTPFLPVQEVSRAAFGIPAPQQ